MSNTHHLRRRFRPTVLLVGMAISLGLVAVPAQAHPEHRKYKKLVREGVSVAVLAQVMRFRGLVKGGAPLVVDFRLPSDGHLELEIKTRNVRRRKTIEFPAKAGDRKVAVRVLPKHFGTWQTGRFKLSAFDESGQQIDFRLFGIGAGTRAVGTTGICDVTFEPTTISDQQPADWSFWSYHDFERSRLVLYRREQDGSDEENLAGVLDKPCRPRRNEACEGDWDLRDNKGNRAPGRYRLAVKVWQETDLEKDWMIEWSEDQVEVQ